MSLAREPMNDLDVKIMQEAAALREHVEASASTDLAWADFEARRTGAVAFVRPSRDDRRGWMVMATVGMAAAVLATLVLVRVANEKPPSVRPSGPTITPESYEGTVARLNGDLVVVGVDGNEQVIGHIPASVLQSEQLVGGWPSGVAEYLRADLSSAGWVAVTGFVSEGFWFFDLRDPSLAPRWVALAGRTSGSTSAGTWNPDGTLFAAVEKDTTAVIIDPATGQLSRLPSVDPPLGYPPTWTADGSGILTGETVRCDGGFPSAQRRLAIVPIDGGPESDVIPDLADGLQGVSTGGMWATDDRCTADAGGTPDLLAGASAVVVARSPSGVETWVDAAKITPEVLRHSVFATTRPALWVLTTEEGSPARFLLHEVAAPQSDRVVNTVTFNSAIPQQYVIVGVAPDDSAVVVLVTGPSDGQKFYLVPTDGSPVVQLDDEFAGFVPRSMLNATTTPDTTTPATTSDTTEVAPSTSTPVADGSPALVLPTFPDGKVIASLSAVSDSEWFALSDFGPVGGHQSYPKLWHTNDAGVTWVDTPISSDIAGGAHWVHFADPLNGWLGGQCCLFGTHDGGVTWKPIDGAQPIGDERAAGVVSAGGRVYVLADVPVAGNSTVGVKSSPVDRDEFVWSGTTMGDARWDPRPWSGQLVIRGESGWAIAWGTTSPAPSTATTAGPFPGAVRRINGEWTGWDPPCAASLQGEKQLTTIQVPRLVLGASPSGAAVAVVCKEAKGGGPLRTFVSGDGGTTFVEAAPLPAGATMTERAWLLVPDDNTILLGVALDTGELVVEGSHDGGRSWTVETSFADAKEYVTATVTPTGRIVVVAGTEGRVRGDQGTWVPTGKT